MVLSEVLRERDAQVLHKKKRQDLLKSLEDIFLKSSEKVSTFCYTSKLVNVL